MNTYSALDARVSRDRPVPSTDIKEIATLSAVVVNMLLIVDRNNEENSTKILFGNVTPRIFNGWNNLGTGFPSLCGINAVPAGGFWNGVK